MVFPGDIRRKIRPWTLPFLVAACFVLSERGYTQSERGGKGGWPCLNNCAQLEVRVQELTLKDQFIWDINSLTNSPEDFARNLVRDLKLPSDFVAPVAFSIRDQIWKIRNVRWPNWGRASPHISFFAVQGGGEAERVSSCGTSLRPRQVRFLPVGSVLKVFLEQEVELWGPKVTQLSKTEYESMTKFSQKKKKPRPQE